MQRRHFLHKSGALAGAIYGAVRGLDFAAVEAAAQEETQSVGGESRYQALNRALDRRAMQRGWAQTVDPDYHHAPPAAIEAFKDLKFGIRIHWGLYCLIGSHESWVLAGADRRFWNVYNVLYQFFNPTEFNAEAWMDLFDRGGIKFFTFTTKHHDGFSMWPTKTTHKSIRLTPKAFNRGVEYYETVVHSYSIMDSPYKRDIVRAVVEAGRRKGMGVGFYYSHVDWHDPAFAWDPFNEYYDPSFTKQSDPARWQTFIDHERQQVRELMTDYGRIDYLDFDIGWPEAAAPDIAQIAKMARKLQPNIIMRNRGIGAYGDYTTPERQIPEGPTQSLWKVIYPCGQAFSYLPNDDYKPAEWVLSALIDIVAKGGNFEVGFGPMPNGTWPREMVERLEYVGDWLRVNGEAIYGTRPWNVFREGDDIRFSRSKDGKYVYAISLKWPGEKISLRSVRALPGTPIFMLGVKRALKWQQQSGALVIEIPREIAENRPCRQAYVFKIQAET